MQGIAVRVTGELHKKIKYVCISKQLTINEYITRLIEADLAGTDIRVIQRGSDGNTEIK